MTLLEFYNKYYVHGTITKIRRGFNGKILCTDFNPIKHPHLENRKILSIRPNIECTDSPTFGNIATAILIITVDEKEECDKALGSDSE